MSGTPDVSRIVSLIMENPGLVEQISALAASDSGVADSTESTADTTYTETPKSESASVPPRQDMKRERRAQLLLAMKPYLSQERGKAIDSMMSFMDIMDMMRGR